MGINAKGELIPEFSETNPAIILVERRGNSWEDELGITTRPEMEIRLAAHDQKYVNEWTRRKKGPESKPHYKRHDHHPPAILTQDEWVRFECEFPFLVIVMPESNEEQVAGTPSSPFSQTNQDFPFAANSTPDTNGRNFVLRQVTEASIKQLFYKMIFVVLDKDGKRPALVDPDFFCDR